MLLSTFITYYSSVTPIQVIETGEELGHNYRLQSILISWEYCIGIRFII